MRKIKRLFVIIILYMLCFTGTVFSAYDAYCDWLEFQLASVQVLPDDTVELEIIFTAYQEIADDFLLDCYICAYSCDTNQVLGVTYSQIALEQPFLYSDFASVIKTFDAGDILEDTYYLKVIILDSSDLLHPIRPVTNHANQWTISKTIPQYYYDEAYRVVNTMEIDLQASNHQFLVFGAVTDSHVGIGSVEEALSKASIQHGAFALDFVSEQMNCDFIVNLGDITWQNNIDSDVSYAGAQYTMDTILPAFQNHYGFHLIGNHDQTEDITRQWSLVGQYNCFDSIGLTKERCYGYTDFPDKKVRVICLNTSDYLNGTGAYGISYEQRDFLMSALDLSQKSDCAEWKILVLSHIPLDFYTRTEQYYDYDATKDVINILQAYQNGTSVTITAKTNWKWIFDDIITTKTFTYNYSGKNSAQLIGNIHGHLHNDCYGTLGYTDVSGNIVTTDIPRVSTPNTCFYLGKGDSYPENGNYLANIIQKVSGTAQDTSVTFYAIDLTDEVIYSYAYGAGRDRIIPYGN